MKSLSKQEAEAWGEQHGIALDDLRLLQLNFGDKFQIPVDAGARIAMVARQFKAYDREVQTLVWFTGWGAWPSGERPHLFTRFLTAYGETRPLIEVPAFLPESSEFEDAASCVTLGVLFLWDIFVLGSKTRRLLRYSHDEWGCLAKNKISA